MVLPCKIPPTTGSNDFNEKPSNGDFGIYKTITLADTSMTSRGVAKYPGTQRHPADKCIVNGFTSVEPWASQGTANPSLMAFILLIGPTGSGKSSFIEALAGYKSLGIAGDQLESVTKEVQAYKLLNFKWKGKDVCLIDTPGFLDNRISELAVIDKISRWIEKNAQCVGINRIFYFDRITDTRMTAGRKRSLSVLQAILKTGSDYLEPECRHVIHVTTMWNQISGSGHLTRAVRRFEELRISPELWNSAGLHYVSLARFNGSAFSAKAILDRRGLTGPPFTFFASDWEMPLNPNLSSFIHFSPQSFDLKQQTMLASALCHIVRQRIIMEKETLAALISETCDAMDLPVGVPRDSELIDLLLAQQEVIKNILCDLQDELNSIPRESLNNHAHSNPHKRGIKKKIFRIFPTKLFHFGVTPNLREHS
ncbi:hypothetical protein CVT24_013161 [Panaeolus cyanescens]|uniref:G domain-containing protein n=1 Tax=Panaeolus cyanescens TaxID=181874 RepID=A0A409WA24_9AGAR|nr:hypothetical protein CVT24_013161 [Panaeolus cyanescens]